MAVIKVLQQKMKRRNLLAISLIAILVTVSFLSVTGLFKQQGKDAEVINIAGKQRMLSQKIALLAYQQYHNLMADNVDKNIQKHLIKTANTFSTNQHILSELMVNESNTFPKEVSLLYFNAPYYLNNKINLYAKSAIELSQLQDIDRANRLMERQFDREAVEQLLANLDSVVTKIELHVKQRITSIYILVLSLWLATIISLIAISFFIFRPLQRLITKNYQELFISKQKSAELTLAMNKHAIVYRIEMDKKGTVTDVNQRFIDFYCYSEEEIIGRSVFDICGESYPLEYYENVFKKCVTDEYWHGESINKIKGGRELWLNTTIVPLLNVEDKIESFIVIQSDISDIKQTELALNHLHQITSDVDKSLNEKIQDILVLGKKIFNLPLALISEIHAQEYCVIYCHTPNQEITPGDTFELGSTYCCHTLKADSPLAFHQAGKSEIKEHPCYHAFGLESYIGVPLVVEGHRYGTLNFSGPEPSPKPFTNRELELIQLFSYWISAELTRANHQNKLKSQQSIMEQMAQQARIGAWEIDMVNNSLFWSDMTKEIHELPSDYQPELATAINFYKEGESRKTIQLLIQKCISEETSFEQELQLITAKGNEVWVSARGQSDFENGQCIRLLGSFQDITDKMSAQHKIAAHNQRITLAADSAGIGIWELNLITDELKWDDWMFKLYGITPDTFSGAYESWEHGLHPEDIKRTTEQLRQAIEERCKFDSQFRIIWPDGKIKHIKAAAILSFDDDKKPISMIGVNYDITETIENEIALTKAKEQAEIAVRAKNEFFASMSHEIRTPMNGVIGMLDLVKESPLNQEQQHRIGIADQSAKSLLSLINDVLDFSKIDANQLELENISFNLREMAGDLAEAFAQQTQHKNLELILDLVDIEESLVKGDSNRIRQIFTNLLANAIKFTEQGEVTIRISQQEYSPSHWRIIVAVSDTGIGISKDKQDSLFEAFSQVDASTTRKYGGTGLGLAIVKKLCLCMQGSVSVESIEGQGSTFSCELIIEKSPNYLPFLPIKELQGKRVLIVENNHACGDMIKRQLLAWHIDAHLITSGKHALSVLTESSENSCFDLMILNRQITDIDALSLVKTIRSSSLLDQLKIILMTPMATQHDLINSTQIGIDGHFPKPVITKNLHQALNSLIDTFEKNKASNAMTQEIAKPKDTDTDGLQGIKLLLVEDNRINQMVAMGMLKKIGLSQCVIAVNGQDALEKLNSSDDSQPFDFIFMDCQMPEMDGYEATTLIRAGKAGERYQDISIVAMTANAMLGDKEKCLDAGMDDYLVKPINKDRVLDTLKEFLNKGH